MKLSRRLQATADLIPSDVSVADVGSDRGELSYYLLEQEKIPRAILSDLSKHSLQRAKDLFRGTRYESRTDFRVGPGLEVYAPGEMKYAVMAGMGGKTIVKILEDTPAVLQSLEGIVLQAMGNSENVRRCLERQRFTIDEEILLWEDGHFYTMIRALPGKAEPLTEEEIFAGPCLLRRKDPILKDYLSKEQRDRKAIYDDLTRRNQGQKRREQLCRELELLAEIEKKLR